LLILDDIAHVTKDAAIFGAQRSVAPDPFRKLAVSSIILCSLCVPFEDAGPSPRSLVRFEIAVWPLLKKSSSISVS
jgi:hypothetical protein